jgi:hypothetical protein
MHLLRVRSTLHNGHRQGDNAQMRRERAHNQNRMSVIGLYGNPFASAWRQGAYPKGSSSRLIYTEIICSVNVGWPAGRGEIPSMQADAIGVA